MGFIIRTEGTALAALAEKEAAASAQGGAAFEAFKEDSEAKAIVEAKELGITSDSSFADSGSSDDSSTDDSSSPDDGFDDFDFDADPDGEPDTSESDDTDETDEEEPEAEEPPPGEDTEEDKEAELKKESFRSQSFLPVDSEDQSLIFRQEMFGGWSNAATATWGGITFVASALALMGITYGPSLLMGMFKVVLFTFAKTFKTLDEAYDFISSSVSRYVNRTEKQQASINQLKTSLNELITKEVALPAETGKKLSTSFLEFGDSNDYSKNVVDYTNFIDSKIGKLNQALSGDFAALKKISENRYLGKNFDALAFMEINPQKLGFQNSIASKPGLGVRVETFSLGPMIGNVELQADLCADRLDNWVSVEKAYASSNIRLVAHVHGRETETKLLSPQELLGFLNNLELLAKASLKHQQFYNEISRSRGGVMNSIKQLFIKLAEEDGKVSFKNSVALPLHLKSSFATKVYMTGAMDLHDHTAQVIANGLSYAASLMKLYNAQP